MREQSRHLALRDQKFVSDAITEPIYRLLRVDDYPGLVDASDGEGNSIAGELWSVDQECLGRLDAIECVDAGLYERRKILLTEPLTSADAWFYLQTTDGLPDLGTDWRSR